MSLVTVALAPELEEKVNREAARQGLQLNEYVAKALAEYTSLSEQQQKQFVPSWILPSNDPSEGYDDEFFRMLDEDRMSDRKLFPPELKGISW